MHRHNIGVFWGSYTPSTASKIIVACSGGCHPSIQPVSMEQKASCGALRDHIHRRQPWLAMVVLVDVGRRRLTSDWSTVGIVKIVYGRIFYSYVDPIYSWHLTRQLNKEDEDLCTFCLAGSYAPASMVDICAICMLCSAICILLKFLCNMVLESISFLFRRKISILHKSNFVES